MTRIEQRPEERAAQRALDAAEDVICKRWKPLIVWLLRDGHRRYGELAARLPDTTPKVLTQALRELEQHGIINRWHAAHGPRHTEYALTALGEALTPVIDAMETWGELVVAYRDEARRRAREREEQPQSGKPNIVRETLVEQPLAATGTGDRHPTLAERQRAHPPNVDRPPHDRVPHTGSPRAEASSPSPVSGATPLGARHR